MLIHKANTRRFIEHDKTLITLVPADPTWADGTLTFADGSERNEQAFKIIWTSGTGIFTDSLGTTRRLDFILVGNWDAEVAIGDHWRWGNQRYEITYIEPFNGYEVKCGGTSIGIRPGVTDQG